MEWTEDPSLREDLWVMTRIAPSCDAACNASTAANREDRNNGRSHFAIDSHFTECVNQYKFNRLL